MGRTPHCRSRAVAEDWRMRPMPSGRGRRMLDRASESARRLRTRRTKWVRTDDGVVFLEFSRAEELPLVLKHGARLAPAR
jgi:hypothetical protein